MKKEELEFKSWREIEKFQGVHVTITEKIHGTNAQVHVWRDDESALHARAAKRSGYVDVTGHWYVDVTGHFGFADFVACNEREICDKIGEGRHYGEWVGPGVNSDYGLKEKVFVLFNHHFHQAKKDAGALPPRFDVIPVLYDGPYREGIEREVMAELLKTGSKFSPGFMRPEGVVLAFPQFGSLKKLVFTPEESQWTKGSKQPRDPNYVKPDYAAIAAPFLQPIRLEKLLMRDESYMAGFPKNLPTIVKAYLDDLFKETPNIDDATTTAIKKAAFVFALDVAKQHKEKLDAALQLTR